MRKPLSRATLVAVLLAVSLWGCDSTTSTNTPTTPTPTPTLTTETFTGTPLVVGGTNWHYLSVKAGEVTTTLTTMGPASTVSIGILVGVYDIASNTCAGVLQTDTAKVGTVLIGTASTSVALCLRIYDFGSDTVTETASYTVTVAHY